VSVLGASWVVPVATGTGLPGADRSFGDDGIVDLSRDLPGPAPAYPDEMAVAPDGEIYVLDSEISCRANACVRTYYLTRFSPKGSRDHSYAGSGAKRLLSLQYGSSFLAVDSRGRPTILFVEEAGMTLVRLTPGGSRDPSFGDRGLAKLPCPCDEISGFSVDPRGGIRIVRSEARKVHRSAGSKARHAGFTEVKALLPSGALDRSFGRGGTASMLLDGGNYATTVQGTAGGGVVFVDARWAGGGTPYVGRISGSGLADTGFAKRATRSLAKLSRLRTVRYGGPSVHSIIPRPGGGFDFVGTFEHHGFVVRVDADGSAVKSFADKGLKVLKATIATAIGDRAGRTFAVGVEHLRGFHYERVGQWLDGRYRPLAGFSIDAELATGEEGLSLVLQPGGRPLAFDDGSQVCRGYCPAQPRMARFLKPPADR